MESHLVCFAHGKESGPWGIKIKRLAEIAKIKGYRVESPDYSFTMNPDERAQYLLKLNPKAQKLVLVGSSMGGYVSAVASNELKPCGLFLLAPAFYRDGYRFQSPKPSAEKTSIIHGWQDEVISVNHSIEYARIYKANLHLFNGDHQLLGVLPAIEKLFAEFLEDCHTIPSSEIEVKSES